MYSGPLHNDRLLTASESSTTTLADRLANARMMSKSGYTWDQSGSCAKIRYWHKYTHAYTVCAYWGAKLHSFAWSFMSDKLVSRQSLMQWKTDGNEYNVEKYMHITTYFCYCACLRSI